MLEAALVELETSPSAEGIQAVARALKDADEASIEAAFESQRISVLFEQMEGFEDEDKSEGTLKLQSLYLSAVKALMGKKEGLPRLCGAPQLVGKLALSLDSVEVSICTQVLELLAVLAVTSEAGYEAVRKSVEYFRLVKREAVRFESLVEALQSSKTPTPFKRDVMLFVNTLVNSAPDVEQRVEMRGELVRAGVLEAIERLKQETLAVSTAKGLADDAYELEVQLQVFETVLENDHRQCLASFSDSQEETRLDDVDALFETAKQHALDHDCHSQLLGLMQYLVAIPCFDPLGKEHWARILRSAHRAVLGVDDDFSLGFDDMKTLATWKKTLEQRSSRIDELDKANKTLDARVKELETLNTQLKQGGATAGGVDPKYDKYFKMLKMHIPKEAVVLKMQAAGLDPSVLDGGQQSTSSQAAAADGPPAEEKEPALKDDPRFKKYFTMLRSHIPRGAIEQKMLAEGVDVKILDMDPTKPAPKEPPVKDDPRYKKYFAMVKRRIPKQAVLNEMKKDGVDTAILDLDPDKPLPPATKTKGLAALLRRSPTKKEPSAPKKPNPKPRVAMKSLFWSKIPDDSRDKTVWKNLSDDDVELDLDALELDFAKQKKKSAEEEAAEKEKLEKQQEKKKVTLVDSKVSQNVGIVLHKLKMTNKAICRAIITVDLDAQKTELLLKAVPTPEDADAVADFKGDVTTLGRVELFFREIAAIPDIKPRLECMNFVHKLESSCATLDERLKTVTAACEQVSRSERLAKILEVVLRLGNYLNGGTGRGGVYGFKLDALSKLAAVKSLDNSRSLMNWLVTWCDAAGLSEFKDDFPDVEDASRCSLPQWQADFTQLESKIKLVGQHIAARRKTKLQDDNFVDVMTPFREQAAARAETLSRRFQATEQRFGALVASFGEDPKICGVEDFFKNTLGEFIAQFRKAQQQNDKRKAMEEKARQRELAAEKKAALKAAGEASENLVNDTVATLRSEAADDILAKLQGPRQRRQASRRMHEDDAEKSPALSSNDSPQSDRVRRFYNRVQGVRKESTAQRKLDAFRNRGREPAAWSQHQPRPPSSPHPTTPPGSSSSRVPSDAPASDTPTDAVPRRPDSHEASSAAGIEGPRRASRKASVDTQPELMQRLAGVDSPPKPPVLAPSPGGPSPGGPAQQQGGELLAKLQKMKGRKKKAPAPPPA